MIKSRLSGLKKEIENMSEKEKEIEKSNVIVGIVEKNLEFNYRRGQRLKIVTPN